MEWRASHILLKDKEQAKTLREKLVNNELEFSAAAMEFSSCSSSLKGGDLGWFGPGKMVMTFEYAVKRLKEPGDLSNVIQTQFGYHIIQLTGKR